MARLHRIYIHHENLAKNKENRETTIKAQHLII